MAKFKGPDTRAMLAAGAAGSQAELRAEESGLAQEERRTARTQQGIARGAQMLQQEGARQGELAARKAKLGQQMELGEKQLSVQKRGQDVQAAKSGLMERPGAEQQQGQEPPPTEQETKPLELGPQGRFISTPQAKASQQAATGLARSKQATALQNAQTASLNAQTAFEKAKNAGKLEAQKAAYKSMAKGIETTQGFYEQVMTGETPPGPILRNYAKTNPAAAQALESGDPEEMAAVAGRLLKAQRDNQGLAMMESTGEFPPFWGDPNSPAVKRFNSMAPMVASSLDRASEMMGQEDSALEEATTHEMGQLQRAWRGFASDADKQSFIRRTTARLMREVSEIERARGVEAQASGMQQRLQSADETIARLQQENEALRADPAAGNGGLVEPGQGQEVPRQGVDPERDLRHPQRVPQGQPTPGAQRPAEPGFPGRPSIGR